MLLLACLYVAPLQAYAEEGAAGPVAATVAAQAAMDQDGDRLIAIFDTQDPDEVDEALVQLRWAGITDLRLYAHLMDALRAGKVQRASMRERYVEALGYSGNPAVYAAVRELLADAQVKGVDRSDLQAALALEARYTEIAAAMAPDMAQVTSVQALWAQRHARGLRVADGVRVRWAARDLFLHKHGRASLDVAAEYLRSRMAFTPAGANVEDAMAFLCKALGVSGVAAHEPLLVELANATPSEKVADYAERAAQYFDPAFERTKRRFEQ